MSKYIPGNQKHLTLEDRIYIENELNRGTTFKDIAKFLCKGPTTISKEVKAHRISDWYHKGTFYNAKNFCVHRYHCRKTNACGKIILCGVKCSSCPTCNQTCRDFEKERCSRLDKVPYVCNGCPKKTLLTFFFTKEKLFLTFLMNRCTESAVRLILDRLEKRLGTYGFISTFEHILTDRGTEFGDPEALETGANGIQRTSIYYCDPMHSGQKGGLEQAHTMLRMVLPKGTSFEFLTQWDVNLIVNHINSTPRESLGGRTPYSVVLETLGEEVLNAFQLRPIAPDEVNLTPKLIRFNS